MSQRVHSFIHVPLCSRDTKEICIRLLNIVDFKCRMNRTKLYFEIKPYRFLKEIKSFLSCLDSLTVLKMMEKHTCAHIHIHICNIYINMQLHAYFLLNVRTELRERELWVIVIESENLHPRRCSKAVWQCSWVVGDCTCAGWLDQMTSRGSDCQSLPSVIPYLNVIIVSWNTKVNSAEVKALFFKSIYLSWSEFKMYSISVHNFSNHNFNKFSQQLTNSKRRIWNWNRKILWECPWKYHEVCHTQPSELKAMQTWRELTCRLGLC